MAALAAPAIAQERFPKDAQVRLTKDTPLLLQAKEVRTGKAGEVFTVVQHNAAAKRVYVLSVGADGKPAALNLPDEALEVLGPDRAALAADVEELTNRNDFAGAGRLVQSVIVIAPGDASLQQLMTALPAASAANVRLNRAQQAAAAAPQRIQQLQRNAQLAAQPNRLNPGDRSGATRAQVLAQEATLLAQTTAKESADAATAQAAAASSLSGILVQLKAAPAPAGLAAAVPTGPAPATGPQFATISPPSAPVTTVRMTDLTMAGIQCAPDNYQAALRKFCQPAVDDYLRQLKALADRLQKTGNLPELLPVQEEIKATEEREDYATFPHSNASKGEMSPLRDAFLKRIETTVSEFQECALDLSEETVRQLTMSGRIEEATTLGKELEKMGRRQPKLEKVMPVDGPRMVIGRAPYNGMQFGGKPFRLASANGGTVFVYPPGEAEAKPLPISVTDYGLRQQVRRQCYPLLTANLFTPGVPKAEEHNFHLVRSKVLQVLPQGLLLDTVIIPLNQEDRIEEPNQRVLLTGYPDRLVDGEYSGDCVTRQKEVFQYTSVSGATKTIRTFEFIRKGER